MKMYIKRVINIGYEGRGEVGKKRQFKKFITLVIKQVYIV